MLKKGSVVTIGVFDGVHIGHRKIITEAIRRARALKSKSVVVTFEPHPMKILKPGRRIPSLISLAHRIMLIKQLGADEVAVLNFTSALSRLGAESFVKDILIKRLGAREIIVGGNFYFGRGAKAGGAVLERIAKRSGLKVMVIKPVRRKGRIVSSSVIRCLIMKGKLREASAILDRPVSILGTVVSGSKFARLLGYPTANINPHHETVPPFGVYAVRVRVGRRFYGGLLNIGTQDIFFSSRDKEPKIEVHIFGFDKKIYGKDVEVSFVKKLREERRFVSQDTLIAQIKKDSCHARRALAQNYR